MHACAHLQTFSFNYLCQCHDYIRGVALFMNENVKSILMNRMQHFKEHPHTNHFKTWLVIFPQKPVKYVGGELYGIFSGASARRLQQNNGA